MQMLDAAFTLLGLGGRAAYEARMDPTPSTPRSAGCLLLAGFLIGAGVGIASGEASLGVLVGVASGVVLALLFWLLDRRRG